jgi:drug/metabolite transporter (DMT)-like permease
MSAAKPPRLRADLALVGVCFVWGTTFVLVKEALTHVSTVLFLTIRFTMAAIALLILFRGGGRRRRGERRLELRAGFLVGLCLFSGYCLQTQGLRFTTPAKAGFITGFYIPLVPVIGAIVYRRLPRMVEIAGVLLAAAGLGLLTLESAQFDIGFGDLLVLGSTVAYASHILVLGHFAKKVSFEILSLYQISTGALLGMGMFWWIETPRIEWTASVVLALLVTSLLATALAFSVQSWAQQFTTPTRTALIFAMEPVFAWLMSYLVAGEVLTMRAAAGAILILAGILLVELKPMRIAQHPSS